MKRFIAAGSAVAALIVAAVAVARPDWLPTSLRSHVPFVVANGLGPSPAEDAGLYCKEHGVPEKFCTLCHEELKTSLLLCKEHDDIPEDICTLCHPEVKDRYQVRVCKEHGLPESYCAQCGKGPSASLDQPDDGWCATHGTPEALCRACQLDPRSQEGVPGGRKLCRQPLPTVRLASAGLAKEINLGTAPAIEVTHSHTIMANAEVAYDANRYAEISPRVDGFLREVRSDLGRTARRGDVLAVVDSAAVSASKAQYITGRAAVGLAEATYDRTRSLTQSGAIAAKAELEALTTLHQAKASALDAEQRLRNYGFSDDRLARILKTNDTTSLLDVVTPLDGSIVGRHAVEGEAVQSTSQIFSVADTSRMWLWIDVYEAGIRDVAVAQRVDFTISGTDETFTGTVTWVGTEVDDTSRTTRLRAEIANSAGRLRARQYGQAEIHVGEAHTAVVVPKAAVQRKDNVDVVFLPEEPGVYRPQRITTRPSGRPDTVEVTWGLKPGQRVVTTRAFLLKTEIMKGAIGAGCCPGD